VDDSQIIQSYAISATQPVTEVNVLVNPRLAVKQTAADRKTAFVAILNAYLDAITAGTHVEGLDFIANTRARVNLTMRIARFIATSEDPGATPTPPPGGGAKVSGVLFNDENGNGTRDGGEAGIAGATVTLSGPTVSVTVGVSVARTAVTNVNGVYTFTGVAEGQYTLQADLPTGQHIAPITVTVSGNGIVTVPPTPVQVGNEIYLPNLQRG